MKKSIKTILWTIFWTIILSQLLTAIAGWTIVDPILNLIMPAKVYIEPLTFPQLHDGKQWIRVNLLNTGLSDVDSINVDYKLCSDDEYKRGVLHSSTLKRDERDYHPYSRLYSHFPTEYSPYQTGNH